MASDQMNFTGELPRVVVVLACKESASVAEIRKPNPGDPDGAIEVESKNNHKIYYLWLLVEPTDALLAEGVVRIAADHAGKPAAANPHAVARVLTRLSAQVSAADLQKGE